MLSVQQEQQQPPLHLQRLRRRLPVRPALWQLLMLLAGQKQQQLRLSMLLLPSHPGWQQLMLLPKQRQQQRQQMPALTSCLRPRLQHPLPLLLKWQRKLPPPLACQQL